MNWKYNEPDRKRKQERAPGQDFIRRICSLYNDSYDDREEDSRPGGENWTPGGKALHTSLESFRRELRDCGRRNGAGKLQNCMSGTAACTGWRKNWGCPRAL